jgi:hypothetical protein
LARERQAKLEKMAKEVEEREYVLKKLRSELQALVNKNQFVELIWGRAIFESNSRLRTLRGLPLMRVRRGGRGTWEEAQNKK